MARHEYSATALHALFTGLPILMLMNHDMIHAAPPKRREVAAGTLLAPLWTSRAFDRVSTGHMRHHHDPTAQGRFYSLIPYGGPFLYMLCSDFEDGHEDVVHKGVARRKMEPWAKGN